MHFDKTIIFTHKHTLSPVAPPPALLGGVRTFPLAAVRREAEQRLTDWQEFLSAPQISWNHGPSARPRPDKYPDQHHIPDRSRSCINGNVEWNSVAVFFPHKFYVFSGNRWFPHLLILSPTNPYFLFFSVQMLRSVSVLLLLVAAVCNAEVSLNVC